MDEWAQSFKAIHGKTPTKFERAQILEAKNPGLNGEATPRQIFKRSELKPPTKVTTTASSAKVKAVSILVYSLFTCFLDVSKDVGQNWSCAKTICVSDQAFGPSLAIKIAKS
jgi:hypothetical protein